MKQLPPRHSDPLLRLYHLLAVLELVHRLRVVPAWSVVVPITQDVEDHPAQLPRATGFHPGPRMIWPGSAPVCSPSFSTCTPFTNTWTVPVEYWCGFSNVA